MNAPRAPVQMSDLTSPTILDLFRSYELEGSQDIWFEALDPAEVEALFSYACSFVAGPPRRLSPARPEHSYSRFDRTALHWRDDHQYLTGFRFRGESFDDVCVRIEDDGFAVDFDSGLDRWHHSRITAFIAWLRVLWKHGPRARLVWAHEGGRRRPELELTAILQASVRAGA